MPTSSWINIFAAWLLCLCVPFELAAAQAAPSSTINVNRLDRVKKQIAAIRGLEFTAEVAVEVKNKDEMKKYLEATLLEEYGDQKLADIAMAYAKLGLFPRQFDLKKSLLDFYSAQIVALYDPTHRKLVLPDDRAEEFVRSEAPDVKNMMDDMVLAHELTHALQDQHFSLKDRLGVSTNDDNTTAFRALIEGDATLAGFSILRGETDPKFLATIGKLIQTDLKQKESDFSSTPEALIEQLLFQYYGGVSLVLRVLSEKGWPGVNRLYAAPPLSTEQVLHPEKYLVSPDPPTVIELTDLAPLFSPDWKEVENNNLGELMVQVLFKEFLSEADGKLVANGWDGDRFVAFRRSDEIAFVWATVWDSTKDAQEFTERYRGLLARKYGADPEGAKSVYLERRDTRVVVVEGLEPKHVRESIEKIWQGMKVEEMAFSLPFPAPPARTKQIEAP